jgi:predicted HicB family RNase H-like nuclease
MPASRDFTLIVSHTEIQAKLGRLIDRNPLVVLKDLENREKTHSEYKCVLQFAQKLYEQDPDWATFFREVLGIDGVVRRTFPSFEELTKFEQSEEFNRIQQLLVRLRERRSSDPESEATRVITVRLPKSMHEYLRSEAHDLRTSMNKLCISKLLQVIKEEMIPAEPSSEEIERTENLIVRRSFCLRLDHSTSGVLMRRRN